MSFVRIYFLYYCFFIYIMVFIMTIEEIRKGAPSGATHYKIVDHRVIYYKYAKYDGGFMIWIGFWNKDSLHNYFNDETKPL